MQRSTETSKRQNSILPPPPSPPPPPLLTAKAALNPSTHTYYGTSTDSSSSSSASLLSLSSSRGDTIMTKLLSELHKVDNFYRVVESGAEVSFKALQTQINIIVSERKKGENGKRDSGNNSHTGTMKGSSSSSSNDIHIMGAGGGGAGGHDSASSSPSHSPTETPPLMPQPSHASLLLHWHLPRSLLHAQQSQLTNSTTSYSSHLPPVIKSLTCPPLTLTPLTNIICQSILLTPPPPSPLLYLLLPQPHPTPSPPTSSIPSIPTSPTPTPQPR